MCKFEELPELLQIAVILGVIIGAFTLIVVLLVYAPWVLISLVMTWCAVSVYILARIYI